MLTLRGIALIGTLMSCYTGNGLGSCPETPYTPSGPFALLSEACSEGETLAESECPFVCDEETCDGEPGARSCEPCDDVDAFADGDCEGCWESYPDGFLRLTCSGYK
jgi:hypothetical protein